MQNKKHDSYFPGISTNKCTLTCTLNTDLKPALTRDTLALQMNFDLCDIIHLHTQSFAEAVKSL